MTIKHGFLVDYFQCFGYKRIKPVEIDPSVSNEHEFNGINKFKEILGVDKKTFPCRVIFLSDDEEEIIENHVHLTWYDARANHPSRTEYRLYYPEADCYTKANPEDLMILAKSKKDSYTMFIAQNENTIANQLAWLFGISEKKLTTKGKADVVDKNASLDYFSNLILEKIGIPIEQPDDNLLDKILEKFPNGLPKTAEFSSFARSLVADINPLENPDVALSEWLDYEEYIFRVFEKHILQEKISSGFKDVDDFIAFSLSVQNRRKSRAGYALENHLKYLFTCLDIKYAYNPVTEYKSRPDFIFPGIDEYHDNSFPSANLAMLGVKTTCKERWKQVLSEAKRIERKHLCTLEPGISQFQTDEMIGSNLQLVVPAGIVSTYNLQQQKWLMTLTDFTEFVKDIQRKSNVWLI